MTKRQRVGVFSFMVLATPFVVLMGIGAVAAFAGTGFAVYEAARHGVLWVIPVMLVVPIVVLLVWLASRVADWWRWR